MTWYYGLIIAVVLLPAAAWVQLVLHEVSHWAFAVWFEKRTRVGIWVWPHWFAQSVEKPVVWWLPGRKAPELSFFVGYPHWSKVYFYLGRCWTRGDNEGKHLPRCIAPMWAGLAAFLVFGALCFLYWPVFAPFSFYGLLHVADFWKDALWGSENSDGYKWRHGTN